LDPDFYKSPASSAPQQYSCEGRHPGRDKEHFPKSRLVRFVRSVPSKYFRIPDNPEVILESYWRDSTNAGVSRSNDYHQNATWQDEPVSSFLKTHKAVNLGLIYETTLR
jgi:hypothetical protein